MNTPTREETLLLLKKYNSDNYLINHALSVEGVMRFMAEKNSEDVEKWGVIGLIHDIDFEQFPGQHCAKVKEILEEHSWPEEYIRAVTSHGWNICTDVKPETKLEQTLYAVDELTGLIYACALVRPSRSVKDLTTKSVKKKWKNKKFAAGVNREVISDGAKMLNVEVDDLIKDVIDGMNEIADDIGM